MSRLVQLYRSTIGKKFVVAITGIVLFGFVVMHMAGNLKAFTGNASDGVPHVDIYAHFLRTMGEPMLPYAVALWIVRIILLISLILHVVTVLDLVAINRAARNVGYAGHDYDQSTWPARMMMFSGILLLIFVIFHILQFTTGTINVTPIIEGKVYANLYHAFHKWFFALIYVVAMALLAVHLYHGAWSLFQTIGIDNPDRNRGLRMFAAVAAAILFIGFSSVPVLFYMNAMPDPPAAEPMAKHVIAGGF